MIPCSVYIVTLNCAEWLDSTHGKCKRLFQKGHYFRLRQYISYTYAIAESFPNTRISHQDWPGLCGSKKSLALAQCKNDWVLNLDGDEVLSSELKVEIEQTIQSNQLGCFNYTN